jgi:ABC-2 type transport system ATP-binding protein
VDSPGAAVEAQSLTKSYGRARTRGIVEVDLIIDRGDVLGLVGANGAGKTTLMRTMLDFIRPTSGTLRLLGMDSAAEAVQIRRRVTYLPGELVFPARLTGRQVVGRYLAARPEVGAARITQVASDLDVDLSRPVGDLSRGNKQKIGLLLAFAPRADLLVLDEPTSGLDPLLQRQFASMVRQVAADGAAVLLSSHVMSEVEQVARRVALMREGRLFAVETLSEVIAKGRRRGRARPRDPATAPALAQDLRRTSGVSDVEVADGGQDEGLVTFAVTGDVNPLLATVSRHLLASFDLAHADLEDAFFGAYEDPR